VIAGRRTVPRAAPALGGWPSLATVVSAGAAGALRAGHRHDAAAQAVRAVPGDGPAAQATRLAVAHVLALDDGPEHDRWRRNLAACEAALLDGDSAPAPRDDGRGRRGGVARGGTGGLTRQFPECRLCRKRARARLCVRTGGHDVSHRGPLERRRAGPVPVLRCRLAAAAGGCGGWPLGCCAVHAVRRNEDDRERSRRPAAASLRLNAIATREAERASKSTP